MTSVMQSRYNYYYCTALCGACTYCVLTSLESNFFFWNNYTDDRCYYNYLFYLFPIGFRILVLVVIKFVIAVHRGPGPQRHSSVELLGHGLIWSSDEWKVKYTTSDWHNTIEKPYRLYIKFELIVSWNEVVLYRSHNKWTLWFGSEWSIK